MAGFAGAWRPTQVGTPPPRLTLGTHLLSLYGHQWLARCAVAAIQASPVL